MFLRAVGGRTRAAGFIAIILIMSLWSGASPLTAAGRSTPPTTTPIDDITLGVNSATGALNFTIADAETPAASLIVTASSSDQTLVPNANIVLGGSGASRSVTVTPAANQTGSAVITLTVTDLDGDFVTEMFTVEVITPKLLIDGFALIEEGQSGTTNVVFTVLLNDDISIKNATVTVNWATANAPAPGPCGFCSTAIPGRDYVAASGTLTFAPFETSKTISVAVIGDGVPEVDEWFFVNLTAPINAALDGDGAGLALIFNDDFQSAFQAQPVRWVQPAGVVGDFGELFKDGATGWNAGAASSKAIISGNGGVEFTAGEADTVRIAGLSRGNTDTGFNDIDFGIELYFNGRVLVTENGVIRPTGAVTYLEGDRFGVAVESGQVVYRKNGVAFYTSTVAPTYPLAVDTALYSDTATLIDVVLSGRMADDVFFTNEVNVFSDFNDVDKDADDGWNAGAASDRAIVKGDGFMEFTALETDTTRMAGLSSDNSTTDYSDIDFGIYLHSNATVYVVEGGITRGLFGSYASGDRFQVAVEAGVVKYRRNGVLMYTSSVTPTYPLMIDTAFYSDLGTLRDVAIFGEQATDVTFADQVNVETCACGNSLFKLTGVPDGWNAGGISNQFLVKGEGFVEFTIDDEPTFKILGLSHGNSNQDYADVDFGILFEPGQHYLIYEGGAYRSVYGAYAYGDRFRVSVEGGVVKYRRNGVLIYTSAVTPTYPLVVDTSLYSELASIYDVVMWSNPAEDVVWTSAAGVTPQTGMLTKTGADGWNAGAVSTRAIPSGDGFVSFTTDESTGHKMLGLSVGNSNNNYTDIDFGIILTAQGGVFVYETGTSRGSFARYVSGDLFQVAVESGVVKYLKNGQVFYTSGVAPSYPLLVDTALYTHGSTLTKVVLGCVSAACQ